MFSVDVYVDVNVDIPGLFYLSALLEKRGVGAATTGELTALTMPTALCEGNSNTATRNLQHAARNTQHATRNTAMATNTATVTCT